MRIISFRHATFCFRHAAHGVWSCGVFISSCGVLPPLMGRLASPIPSLISTGFCCAVLCRLERCSVRGRCSVEYLPCRVLCWVLFSTWAVPAQLCSQYGKCRWLSCPTLSTITRLPSGSSISRSVAFRYGVLSVGTGTAHRCTGALAAHRRIPTPPVTFRSA